MRTLSLTQLKRGPWLAAAAVGALALLAAPWLAMRGRPRSTPNVVSAPSAVASPSILLALDSPKAGELVITPEALQLAEIRVAPATSRPVAENLPVTGVVEAAGDGLVKVTPRISGKIVSVSGVVGEAVRAGQVLARLESIDLAKAQAEYHHALIDLAIARKALQRQRKLAELGAFANPALEQARRDAAEARGEVNTGASEVSAAETQVAEERGEKASWEGEVSAAQSDVAGAEGGVAQAESQVAALQAALAQAEAQVKVTHSALLRHQRLLESGVTSRSQVEQAQAAYEQARAGVTAAQANIRQGEKQVESAGARVRAAQAKVRAAEGRVDQSAAAIETALARRQQAEARLEEARKHADIADQTMAREEAVARGGYRTSKELVEAEGALQNAEHEVEHTTRAIRLLGGVPGSGSVIPITAPIAGKIHERQVSVGETVDAEESVHALFTIVNLDLVWAQIAVPPADLPRVRVGQRVTLAADTAPGRRFTGSVSAIGSAADEKTRTVQVRCALENRAGTLRPGTFVRGEIVTDHRPQRLTVPSGALQDHNGKPTLYVARQEIPGGFEVRHVQLGAKGDGWVEVGRGLSSGERIAVNGTFYLKSEAMKSSLSDGCCAVESR